MSLSDYDDELRQIDAMTKAHQDKENNSEYCRICNIWHSRYDIPQCVQRQKFKQYLIDFLNYNVKHGCIDDELADEVLNEWSHEHQKEWLERMEAKADAYYKAYKEEESQRDED